MKDPNKAINEALISMVKSPQWRWNTRMHVMTLGSIDEAFELGSTGEVFATETVVPDYTNPTTFLLMKGLACEIYNADAFLINEASITFLRHGRKVAEVDFEPLESRANNSVYAIIQAIALAPKNDVAFATIAK